ncbi:MAG: nitroreductase family protein [Legionella sp.]|uniref:nitroreductase family protein n=1 Tax=Legionella sp. TaxID=459 RepID=UPI0039E45659
MASSKKINHDKTSMNVMDVIYNRRAVRNYFATKIDQDLIDTLLNAAIQAPTAMHEEPWSFVIIQNKDLLNRLSESTKKLILAEANHSEPQKAKHIIDLIKPAEFNIFYNAGTLIIIYSKFHGSFVSADCWLAAENLMLAAYTNGLGTCVIGFAVSALNTHEWKRELGVSEEMTAIVPIIIGWPAGKTPPSPRKSPEILTWK